MAFWVKKHCWTKLEILSRAKFCREFYADRVDPASYFASVARALYPATLSAEYCSGEYSQIPFMQHLQLI